MSERLSIPQAMLWKYGPQALCSKNSDGDGIEIWEHPTIPKPNRIEVLRILDEYEAYLTKTIYKKKRQQEYPSIEDQLDALWKGGQEAQEMKARIEAVKAKYPKPA